MDLTRLKRFDKDKHDQLEQLIAWSQMMGLSGTDLVSLGGHIARSEARQKALSNRSAVDALGCEPIGKDSRIHDRWKFKSNGSTYWFEGDGCEHVRITNTSTKTRKLYAVDTWKCEVGKLHWRRRFFYAVMLSVIDHTILLNF